MTFSALRSPLRSIGCVAAAAALLAGCASTSAGSSGHYAKPIGNAPVTSN